MYPIPDWVIGLVLIAFFLFVHWWSSTVFPRHRPPA